VRLRVELMSCRRRGARGVGGGEATHERRTQDTLRVDDKGEAEWQEDSEIEQEQCGSFRVSNR